MDSKGHVHPLVHYTDFKNFRAARPRTRNGTGSQTRMTGFEYEYRLRLSTSMSSKVDAPSLSVGKCTG